MANARLSKDSIFVVKSQKGYLAKSALLDAGIGLIARSGVAGFSVGELCDVAGLKRTSFYSYFSSVTDMLEELALREDESFDSKFFDDYGDLTAGVQSICGCLLKFFSVVRTDTLWCQFVMKMYSQHATTTERMKAHYREFVELGIEQGGFGLHESEVDTYVGLILSAQNLVVDEAIAKRTSKEFELRLIKMVLRAGNADEAELEKVIKARIHKIA